VAIYRGALSLRHHIVMIEQAGARCGQIAKSHAVNLAHSTCEKCHTQGEAMPTICMFYGVIISMYFEIADKHICPISMCAIRE
jgi:hypothetical protein